MQLDGSYFAQDSHIKRTEVITSRRCWKRT